MIDILRVLLALLMVLCLILGWWAGRWYERRQPGTQQKRRLEVVLAVDGATTYYIRDFAMLDVGKAKALASRIARGVPIRCNKMVGKGRLLTRREWDNVIIEGLLAHGKLVRERNRTLTPTPEFVKVCAELVHAHARTDSHGRTSMI
jgi:hypothetical protein